MEHTEGWWPENNHSKPQRTLACPLRLVGSGAPGTPDVRGLGKKPDGPRAGWVAGAYLAAGFEVLQSVRLPFF